MNDAALSPPAALIDTLNAWRRFVCIGHVTPDADCLGAIFAVARVWTARGAHVTVALPEGSLSNRLAFMAELAEVGRAGPEDFAAAEGFFLADTARKSRSNLPPGVPEDWPAGRPVLCVDHHVSNTTFGDVNWVVPDAASTCELVHHLIGRAGGPLDAATASLLLAGIYTDTAAFSLPTTTADTLRTAAELVEAGADIATIGARLRRSQSVSDFNLQRLIYNNTHLAAGGRIAYSTAGHAEIAAVGSQAADIDEQINIPRSLGGVSIAMLFTEATPGKTRVNFRGDAGTDVLELARRFSGGGHREAAGAMLDCSAAEAVARVLPAAIDLLNGNHGSPAGALQTAGLEGENEP